MSILLGSHLPLCGPSYFEGTAELAREFGESAVMFYTGAPQNTKRAELSKMKIQEGDALLRQEGILSPARVVHAPYIVNLANRSDPDKLKAMEGFLRKELERAAAFGAGVLVLHPGSHLGAGEEEGIHNLLLSLEETLVEDSPVLLAIETMAGKGGELGSTLEGVQKIIEGYSHPDRLAVCLDTCHLSDAGYDVSDLSGLKGEIERTVGLSRVKAIHLNDSKNPRGSHKDRHANLGQGYIGFDTLSRWAHDPDFAAVPKILETPYFDGKPPYKKEIEMLRSNSYDPDFLSKL